MKGIEKKAMLTQRGWMIAVAASVAVNIFLLGILCSHLLQHDPVVRLELPLQIDKAVEAVNAIQFPLDPGIKMGALSSAMLRELTPRYESIAKLPEHAEVVQSIVSMQQKMKNGRIIVMDIGMNLGAVSFAILSACENCFVYAFEPIPQYFAFAKQKLLQSFANRVRVFNYAICDAMGDRTIHMDGAGVGVNVGWNTLISSKKTDSQRDLSIVCITLDEAYKQLLQPEGVDRVHFIKIDVEGAEHLVFRGGRSFFAAHAFPKPLLHVEIGWANERADWSEEIQEFEFLFAHGYERFAYEQIHGTQNLFIQPVLKAE